MDGKKCLLSYAGITRIRFKGHSQPSRAPLAALQTTIVYDITTLNKIGPFN